MKRVTTLSVDDINITQTLEKAKRLLSEDKTASDPLKSMFELLLMIITLLLRRLGVNSGNSSKPPSQDPNRKRGGLQKGKSGKKPGGQKGHQGKTLEICDAPDEIISIEIDKRTLPQGEYKEADVERRQVIDIIVSKHITEYQAQVLIHQGDGKRYTAAFPECASAPVQYGSTIRSMATYLSLWQLLPYDRIHEFFSDHAEIPISPGSVFKFNKEAYERLYEFENIIKQKMITSSVAHADETGINVNGKTIWLHSVSNGCWTLFYPHAKRGNEATDEIGVLPLFKGTLVHDCWGPYFKYQCAHAICNAHILRELIAIQENYGYKWAYDTEKLLRQLNKDTILAGGVLSSSAIAEAYKKYDMIMKRGNKESPPPEPELRKKKGRQKKSKARNLLDRLIEYRNEILHFIINPDVPFSNNLAENDIRMTKVQQKISGCFRSIEGAKIFCRVRSYLSTCRKNGLSATIALELLFQGKLPDFIKK